MNKRRERVNEIFKIALKVIVRIIIVALILFIIFWVIMMFRLSHVQLFS
jgi:hypothetical protein